jgi:tight adherence protein B
MELLISLIIFLMTVTLGLLMIRRRNTRNVERGMLKRVTQPVVKQEPEDTTIMRAADPPGRLAILLPGAQLLRRLQVLLNQAAVHASATDMVVLTLALGAGGAILGWAWYGAMFYVLWCALVLGALPLLYVLWRRRRRLRAFDEQLPEILDMLKASLEAGHTLQRALQVGIDEFAQPAANELKIVLEQNTLGIALEQSLEMMLERLPNDNLRFLVAAVKIQAQAGSSLARIIAELARTVRDRHRIEMKVRVLTAQPRLSGIAAGFLPILVAIGMHFINPEHVNMLLFDPAGIIITKIAVVLEITAFIVIYRMVRLDY